MPLYTYQCEICGDKADHFRLMEERNEPARCKCGGSAPRAIERANVNPDYAPYLDENLVPMHSTAPGTWVQSRKHRRQIMRELGLTEAG